MPAKSENPVSRCGACGVEDDEPKHQILVGFSNDHTGGLMFHEHDHAREGCIYYHFHCPSEWHNLHTALGVHEDPQAHAERMAVADRHAAIVAAAQAGKRGDALRKHIASLNTEEGA